MKLTISTAILKKLINKSIKGASCNRFIDFTNWVNLKIKDNVLTLITCDSSNYLYVKEQDVNCEDADLIIPIQIFAKTINKTTTDKITLEVEEENVLKVTGNGVYSISLPVDAEFDDPVADLEFEECTAKFSLKTIKDMLNISKQAMATTAEKPQYTGYYVKDSIITTNSYKITCIHTPLLEEAVLFNKNMIDLAGIIEEDEIEFYKFNKIAVLKTSDVIVYGFLLNGIENFKIDAIQNLINLKGENYCTVDRADLLSTLDRILLFADGLTKQIVKLNFDDTGITIQNKNASSFEKVNYIKNEGKTYDCLININLLMSQLNVLSDKEVTIYYGQHILRIATPTITQVVCLEVE